MNPDLVGAFGFLVGSMSIYFAANAMVFGSVASASSWEPFRRVMQAAATAYFANKTLKEKHKYFLDMVRWSPEAPNGTAYESATPCSQNKGIIDDNGDL